MIELQHVWVERQGRTILADVDFEVRRGEFVYLLGSTGAGKTTILRLIVFEERPSRGAVFVGDFESEAIRERDIPALRRKVGVCFQDSKLLRDRTVFGNVAFALEVTGARGSTVRRRTLELLARLDLIHRREAYPHMLSGGEQQRVAFARALANDPFVLLADEPTANLDPETAARIMGVLAEANVRGTSVIMATHDAALVEQYPRRTLCLVEGRLQAWHSRPAGAGR